MPQFEEILPPPFVSLTVGGPVHGFSHDSSIVSDTRVLSFVPTRMHSGLEMSVCMMAGDSRGLCRPIGDGTERCFHIKVHRCQYAAQEGEDFLHISGLFEMNWIQMWALNPTYLKPETPAADSQEIVNVGMLYQIQEGENVYDIARKFGMTLSQMMFLNADLSSQKRKLWTSKIAVDGKLCIVPNSCHTYV